MVEAGALSGAASSNGATAAPAAMGIVANAAPEPAADVTCPPGAVAGKGARDCPEGFPIKGNASSQIYHPPDRASYSQTIPEFCFASVADAEAAGYRASRS